MARTVASEGRTALGEALAGNEPGIEVALTAEEQAERSADRLYWTPLKLELEQMRRNR